MRTDENGSRWARGGLVFGIAASITGNVANACLTNSAVSLWLTVPLAIVWPIGMFLAIEVLVRNRHRNGFLARVGQASLLTVAVPTAVTSFVNLHALMVKANEPGIAQLSGPLAIDGLMIGCTIVLLAARSAIVSGPVPTFDSRRGQLSDALDENADLWERLGQEMNAADAPVSPAPFGLTSASEPEATKRRTPRGEISPALKAVVSELINGETPAVREGASKATIARYARVWRILRDNPNAEVDLTVHKVRTELIDDMRAAARLEVVR